MIKLFITDLDGCMSMPWQSPDWKVALQIKELISRSKTERFIPPMTICSGRPMPYIEAISQWFDMEQPMIFESGGGIYDMQTNELIWHPTFDDAREQELDHIKKYLYKEFISRIPGTIPEFAKRTDIGIINQKPEIIHKIYPDIVEWVQNHHPDFEAHYTDASINVISKSTNKGEGIKQLSEYLNIELSEMAYIGDTGGDLPGLEIVGRSYAPKNAKEYVREKVDFALESSVTEAVLEAYQDIIEYNHSLV